MQKQLTQTAVSVIGYGEATNISEYLSEKNYVEFSSCGNAVGR